LEIYSAAERANKNKAWPHLLKAEVYTGKNEKINAIDQFQLAIKTEPDFMDNYIGLSNLYLKYKEKEKALNVYLSAIKDNPDNLNMRLAYADLLVKLNYPTDAILYLYKSADENQRNATLFKSKISDIKWSLADQLPYLSKVTAYDNNMVWLPVMRSWVKPSTIDLSTLLSASDLLINQTFIPGQVLFHPFDGEEPTRLTFIINHNPYATIKTAYGLPDEVIGKSNGIGYKIEISSDGGQSYAPILDKVVNNNVWNIDTLSLNEYQDKDITVRLTSSSLGTFAFDWFQVAFVLLPEDNDYEFLPSSVPDTNTDN
jgi:tetratricopeptide (TPR) repeat protein